MAADDAPSVVQIGQDNSFALVKLDRIVAAAPRPLAAIKDQVAKDLQLDRQLLAARDAATKIVRAISGGTPFAAAIAASGVKTEPPARLDLTRGQVLNGGEQVPPPAKMLFSMQPKQVRMLDAPNRAGFVIVYAESVQPGNVAATPQIVAQSRQQLARVTQQELEQQLLLSIRKQVKIARNPTAIQKLQGELSGSTTE
jgi:peptidyl-prolyl cis-trans isomerase D